MARKKIREHDSKRLLREHIKRLAGLDLPLKTVQVKADTDWVQLLQDNPWLSSTKLVVKPDMLFGKRGKNDLVGLNLDVQGAEAFVRERMGRQLTMNNVTGSLTTFIVEPFVPHDAEFYLSIQTVRSGIDLSFSDAGGVEIEENWDKVKTVHLPATAEAPPGACASADALAPLLAGLPTDARPAMAAFIAGCVAVFEDLDFTLMEMNPFTFDPSTGKPFPLDMRGELDDTAAFRSAKKWGNGSGNGESLEFPLPFGRELSGAEAAIAAMDASTGASLKFSVLNPHGHVWTMVAGGGASVIYADTVGDLGYAAELGNYAEYSGAPNEAETFEYAKKVLSVATAGAGDGKKRALVVGGGIANFTDVAATFKGIIRAMEGAADTIKQAQMKILVRRGGPRYKEGLEAMRALGKRAGLDVEVFGPEASMTGICARAIDWVKA